MDQQINEQQIATYVPRDFDKIHTEKGGIKKLLEMYYEGQSYAAIAKHFGLRKQRIGQIIKPMVLGNVIPDRDAVRDAQVSRMAQEIIKLPEDAPAIV